MESGTRQRTGWLRKLTTFCFFKFLDHISLSFGATDIPITSNHRQTGGNVLGLLIRFSTSSVKCWTVNFCIHPRKGPVINMYQLIIIIIIIIIKIATWRSRSSQIAGSSMLCEQHNSCCYATVQHLMTSFCNIWWHHLYAQFGFWWHKASGFK